MGLSLFKFVQWAPKSHPFCSIVRLQRFGRSRSSKVDDFGTNRKRVYGLPINPSLWLWSYLAPFLRYGDLLAKNCLFSYPSFIRRPRSLCSRWDFALKLTVRKLVMRLSSSDWRPHDRSVSHIDTVPACYRQIDRRTDIGLLWLVLQCSA